MDKIKQDVKAAIELFDEFFADSKIYPGRVQWTLWTKLSWMRDAKWITWQEYNVFMCYYNE